MPMYTTATIISSDAKPPSNPSTWNVPVVAAVVGRGRGGGGGGGGGSGIR